MRRTVMLIALGLVMGPLASAQVANAPELIDAMRGPAIQLRESVSNERTPQEMMAGFDREETMLFPLDHAERVNWQYWPAVRIGLPLERMTVEQRMWSHELLTVLLSSAGYAKATSIMQLERILLDDNLDGLPRSLGHYTVSIFGDPSDAEWAWRFEGHHVSLSISIAGDDITVTPSFFGADPAEIKTGPLAGLRIHGRLEVLAFELVQSLNARQRSRAIISDQAPRDIFSTLLMVPKERWYDWLNALQPEGIRVDTLNEMQQHWVQMIISEAINNYTDDIAAQYRDQIDIESLSFAWMGGTEEGQGHYFRLQNDDFLFEFDNVQDQANHIHSVWRNKATDFGENVLAEHYLSSAH